MPAVELRDLAVHEAAHQAEVAGHLDLIDDLAACQRDHELCQLAHRRLRLAEGPEQPAVALELVAEIAGGHCAQLLEDMLHLGGDCRGGHGDGKRAFWMMYGRYRSHVQDDIMDVGLQGYEGVLLSHLGYTIEFYYARFANPARTQIEIEKVAA